MTLTARDPATDLLLPAQQDLPRPAVPVGTRRSDRGDHGADQLIGQRLDACLPDQALGLRGPDIAASGLAVHARPLRCLPEPGSIQPTAQHLTHLNHTDLPESHR